MKYYTKTPAYIFFIFYIYMMMDLFPVIYNIYIYIYAYIYIKLSKLVDRSRGWLKDSLFISYYTEV